MPLGRHRKPFSTKQKKEQLQAKREKKRNKNDSTTGSEADEEKQRNEEIPDNVNVHPITIKRINQQPKKDTYEKHNPNRFNLQFIKESQEDLKRQKKNSSKALEFKNEFELEIEIEDVYKPSSPLDIPIRPSWSYELSKEQLEQQEKNYFLKYLEKIFENFKMNELSYFEMNLETWRQLWRVLEISDIILFIVDIRFPALHFSPVFYEYCTKTLNKDVILVLNKIDLVPTCEVVAWKHYFKSKFPGLHILLFSSSKQIKHKRRVKSKENDNESSVRDEENEKAIVKSIAAEIYTAKAHRELFECVKSIVKSNVDLQSWSRLTEHFLENAGSAIDKTNISLENFSLTNEETIMNDLINLKHERKRFEHGFVTIGCCGFPNVGKSSLLNSLNGKKVVSVSRTPGHTKHLQTIFLTKQVRLVDCPGLVFPSVVCKPLQVLSGIYPIAQLQEPYSAIRFLSERINVIEILKLKHPNLELGEDEKLIEWSPLDICESWAIKRGYYTAKASRPDAYRASNELLRMSLDGRLCLSLKPKNFIKEKELWINNPETKQLNDVIASVELTAKESSHFNKEKTIIEEDENSEDESNDESENDAYKYFREQLETSDEEKEKKDDSSTTEDEKKVNLKLSKNPFDALLEN